MRRGPALVGVLLGSWVLAACSDEPSPHDQPAQAHNNTPRTRAQASDDEPPTAADSPASPSPVLEARAAPRGHGSKILVTKSGVVVATPPAPQTKYVPPSGSCTAQAIVTREGKRERTAPPTPSLQGRRLTERKVLAQWRFRRLPTQCRPHWLRLAVDVSDDILPGRQQLIRVSDAAGEARVTLPPDLARADTLRASVLDAHGTQSPTISVRIR